MFVLSSCRYKLLVFLDFSGLNTIPCDRRFSGLNTTRRDRRILDLDFSDYPEQIIFQPARYVLGGKLVDTLFRKSYHTWNLWIAMCSGIGNVIRKQEEIWLKSQHKQIMVRNSYQLTSFGPENSNYGALRRNSHSPLN